MRARDYLPLSVGVGDRANFTKEFTQACKALMPLPLSELSAMSSAAASRARARLEAIPPAGPDDDSLYDALSALEDFVELAVSKVCLWVIQTGDLLFLTLFRRGLDIAL